MRTEMGRIRRSTSGRVLAAAIVSLLAALVSIMDAVPARAATAADTLIALSLVCPSPTATTSAQLTVDIRGAGYVPGEQYLIRAMPNGSAQPVSDETGTAAAGSDGGFYDRFVETASWTSTAPARWTVTRASDNTVLVSGVAPVLDCAQQQPPHYDCHLTTDFPARVVIDAPVMRYGVSLHGCAHASFVPEFLTRVNVTGPRHRAAGSVTWDFYGGYAGDGRPVEPYDFHYGPGVFRTVVDPRSGAVEDDSLCSDPTYAGERLQPCLIDWSIAVAPQVIVAKDASRVHLAISARHSSVLLTAQVFRFNGKRFVVAPRGTPVSFQRMCGCGRWHTLTTAHVAANGLVSLRWGNVDGARYRVVTPETRTVWGAASNSARP